MNELERRPRTAISFRTLPLKRLFTTQVMGVEWTWDERHQIIQCCGCDTVSFRIESTHSEDVEVIALSTRRSLVTQSLSDSYFP